MTLTGFSTISCPGMPHRAGERTGEDQRRVAQIKVIINVQAVAAEKLAGGYLNAKQRDILFMLPIALPCSR